MSAKLHWLASYPKSGNTWLRLVLSHLVRPEGEATGINDIGGGSIASDRAWIDQDLGFPSAELTGEELLDVRPAIYRWSAERAETSDYHKIHDACLMTPSGEFLPCAEASGPSVYIVRNPLDVALSFASHLGWSIDKTIAAMDAPGLEMGRRHDGGSTIHVPQILLSWSDHVTSWIDNDAFDMLLLRYEDMLADPMHAFAQVVRHLGIATDSVRLAKAIDATRFKRLQAEEDRAAFKEKPIAAERFFRRGIAGEWQERLSEDQTGAILRAHRPVMERLGYCDAAGKPTVM